jgi:hypothetical protein
MAEDAPFDWNDEEAVVIKGREAIAVYQNGSGGIAIRMEAPAYERDDHIVWFPIEDAQAVIDGIVSHLTLATPACPSPRSRLRRFPGVSRAREARLSRHAIRCRTRAT